jgi:adenosyl cobinamide kinase/adenosyl cobinamide phosphate guanylyltransferase
MMILVTGGARSGKSRHAEALIADSPQRVFSIIARGVLRTGVPPSAGNILMR